MLTPEVTTSSGTSISEAVIVTELSTAASSGSSSRTSLVWPARTSTSPLGKAWPDSIRTSSLTVPGRASMDAKRPERSLGEHRPVVAIQTWSDSTGEPSLRTTMPRTAPVPTVSWALAVQEQAMVAARTIAPKRPKHGMRATVSSGTPAARSLPRPSDSPAEVGVPPAQAGIA